ncbi:homoserine O-acetyltransferase [Bacteroidales bacterium OttesenSCG-928-B11]|nr:homoserine O-acetyltransferase [Bacteroidales bacterium OttesenSCG-928-B11]MDL2325978.1 homoserine O-acetyltransferase [Bacteroidales bacterium OttesenSCG-928-A14]
MKKKSICLKENFPLESGEYLPEIEICYHTSSDSPKNKNVIWLCHALTANSDPSEWWPELVGRGKLFDTEKHFVVCANILASCYGSTGPQSINPKTGTPYLLGFPTISVRDMVRAHELLARHLNIDRINLLVGGSSGGFQAIEWAVSNPDSIKNLCLLACNARISPWGSAFNESQRMALRTDPTFDEQAPGNAGSKGLACARSIALLSYRSHEGYERTQNEESPDCFMANRALTYQRYQGEKLANRFNAYSYYHLTQSLDTHNVGRGRGGVEEALAKVKAKTLCIAVSGDVLFPASEVEYLARHIPNANYELIDSLYGHDGFLLEAEQIKNHITKHFNL